MLKRITYYGIGGRVLYEREGSDAFEPTLTFLAGIRFKYPDITHIEIDARCEETKFAWFTIVTIYVE
jgi:hypothetical protein